MKTKSGIKAGGRKFNHNETLVRMPGLKTKTRIKAGGKRPNHNETLVRTA